MTIQQAAQQALDVQYACNASGTIRSPHEITSEVLWTEANRLGSKYVNGNPIAESHSTRNWLGGDLAAIYHPSWTSERNARGFAGRFTALWHLLTSNAEPRRPPGGNESFQIEFEHCLLQLIKRKRVEC